MTSCILFFIFLCTIPIYSKDNNNTSIDQYEKLILEAEDFRSNGQYEKTIEILEKIFELKQKIPDKKKEIGVFFELGTMYWNIGNLKMATKQYSKALSIAKSNSLIVQEEKSKKALDIGSLYDLGKKYRALGDYQKSIASFQEAIKLSQEIGSMDHEVKCLRQLSITYWDINDFYKYFHLNEKAFKIAQILKHKKEEGRCLKNLGLFYWKLAYFSKAIDYYEKALSIAEQNNDNGMIPDYLNHIGVIYRNIGNYEKSLDYLTRAFNKAQELNDADLLSMILNNIGNTYRDKGLLLSEKEDFYLALNYHERSLAIAKQNNDINTEIEVLNNLGSVYTDLENYQKALDYFQLGYKKAEEIQDLESIGMILNNIGIVYYNQGNYEESTKYYQKAIDLAQKLKGGQILWEAFFELGNSYAKQNKYFEALKNYKNSIRIVENIRSQLTLEELKASYLGTDKRIEAYHNLIHILVALHDENNELGYDREAFNYLERAKARAFLDSLEVSQVDISLGINFKLKNREKELMKDISNIYNKLLAAELTSEEIDSLQQQLTEKENELETLKREIRSKSPDYADLKYPEIISLKETQKELLDKKSAFIAYTIGNEDSYGFSITKNSMKIFPIPKKSEIQNLISVYLKTIADKDTEDFSPGYELFKILVLPGLDQNIKEITFIPADILNFLPFETLITQKHSIHWLIEDYKIDYVPSISSYREIIQRKKTAKSKRPYDILAFGDPDYGPVESETNGDDIFQNFYSSSAFNFYRLKYSGIEIDKIKSLFKRNKEEIFVRDAATESQLKNLDLDDFKIIHFAAHSLIDDEIPARSSIVLSLKNDTMEDGFVQMREIYNLKLNADLVTLSACQTGLGQYIRGEGIEGLNRAFFFAGSSSVLMSLWAVNDQATYQLMERFYTHLRSSSQIVNSLREAKLEMINSETVSHPYYWAGFIVSGEANYVVFPKNLGRWLFIGGTFFLVGGLIFIAVRRNGSLSRHPGLVLHRKSSKRDYPPETKSSDKRIRNSI